MAKDDDEELRELQALALELAEPGIKPSTIQRSLRILVSDAIERQKGGGRDGIIDGGTF